MTLNESQRPYDTNDDAYAPYGLCDFGHQGLAHDEETGLVYNRARMVNPIFGRFMQQDPMGYVDGMNWYESYGNNSLIRVDPSGMSIAQTQILANLTPLDAYHSHMEIHVTVGNDIVKGCKCDEIKFKQYYTQIATGYILSINTSRTEDKTGPDGYYIFEDPWKRGGASDEASMRDSPG